MGRAAIKNAQGSGSKLPESDREDMEVFLEKLQQLLPALGVEVFVPTFSPSKESTEPNFLYCDIKGLKAKGYLTPNGLVVIAGSQAVLNLRESTAKYPWSLIMREKLKQDGSLVDGGNCLLFVKDVEFSSPSAAAAVIHGGQANGLTAWKNSSNQSLKELEAIEALS